MEITLKKHVRKISSENNHALPPPPPKKKRHIGDYDLWTKFKMETFKAGELFPNKPLKVQSKTKRFDRRIGFFLSGD